MSTSNNIMPAIVAGLVAGALAALFIVRAVPPQPASTEVTVRGDGSEAGETLQMASAHEAQVVSAVEKARPAVVSVIITEEVPVLESVFDSVPDSPFGSFFGNDFFNLQVPRLEQRGTERREVGGGSGFLISSDGLVITNRHVVESENAEYSVFTNDGEQFEATVLARDPVNDLAVLKIEGDAFPFLTFADSDQLHVGQTVIAIGNALSEFQNTVSTGVVSGLGRSIVAGDGLGQPEQLDEVLQTDAAINPGNSGGPLLNLSGQVIGVNVAVALGSENIGFALPANLVSSIVDSVRETGRIVRPFIGVRYTQITPVLQQRNSLPTDYGVLVVRGDSPEELPVIPGSPADKAGIEEGDIILELDGQRLDEGTSLGRLIQNKQVGDTVQLTILHEGSEQTVSVTLEEIPG